MSQIEPVAYKYTDLYESVGIPYKNYHAMFFIIKPHKDILINVLPKGKELIDMFNNMFSVFKNKVQNVVEYEEDEEIENIEVLLTRFYVQKIGKISGQIR